MKRNLKALGLAMVAVFALSAMAASSAQAVIHHVTVKTAPAIITAHDETGAAQPAFSITAGAHSIKCETATYEGTVKEATNTDVTVRPTYSGCKVDGTIAATVDVNHCAYVLGGETNAEEHGKVEIECSGVAENEITITYSVFGSSCVVHVPAQTPKGGAHYTQTENAESKKQDITVKATVKEIKYTETGGGFCPATTTREDGTLEGGITVTAFKEKEGCTELTGTEKTTPGTHFDNCEGEVQDIELTTTP